MASCAPSTTSFAFSAVPFDGRNRCGRRSTGDVGAPSGHGLGSTSISRENGFLDAMVSEAVGMSALKLTAAVAMISEMWSSIRLSGP